MQITRRATTLAGGAMLLALAAACADQPLSPLRPLGGADAPSLSVGIASALSANITGPSTLHFGSSGTWYANAAGGSGAYTYRWDFRRATATTWTQNVGTGSSYTRTAPFAPFYLRVTVTSGAETASAEQYVDVPIDPQTCGGNPC